MTGDVTSPELRAKLDKMADYFNRRCGIQTRRKSKLEDIGESEYIIRFMDEFHNVDYLYRRPSRTYHRQTTREMARALRFKNYEAAAAAVADIRRRARYPHLLPHIEVLGAPEKR